MADQLAVWIEVRRPVDAHAGDFCLWQGGLGAARLREGDGGG